MTALDIRCIKTVSPKTDLVLGMIAHNFPVPRKQSQVDLSAQGQPLLVAQYVPGQPKLWSKTLP